ncbi:MAG: hypothetical protein R3B93_28490 [Bacteroidia bacterium]
MCALYEAFPSRLTQIPHVSTQPTLAEGIAVSAQWGGMQMIEQIRGNRGGTVLVVEEPEIRESLLKMVRMGYYIEPTTAAIVAGVEQYLSKYAQRGKQWFQC